MSHKVIELEEVVIRFSGDSGDGMQLTGAQFSITSALMGNNIATFPDYPAEIRAPQGTVSGVSGYQLHIGHKEINTPGDYTDVLIAMNPAAIRANIRWVRDGGTIIYDSDSFTENNIKKAGYKEDPIKEDHLTDYNLIKAPITSLTRECLKDMDLDQKSIKQCRNMFALGMIYWIFHRELDYTEHFVEEKFKKKPKIIEANKIVLHAGYYHAEAIHAMPSYRVNRATIKKGKYRNLNGNQATAWGLIAASEKSGLGLYCGSYPITPASEILQELSARKELGVKAFQAEDEIAGVTSAIGASFAGNLGVTTTSGPGLALMSEAIGLSVIMELPLVVINVQRGGPSTGLPTKTEQADLMQALYGRNGESPVVVLAASTPSNCFRYAFHACKIAVERITPVILLTDGFLANGSAPWKIPSMKNLPAITPNFALNGNKYYPYERDPHSMSRKWAIPGMKGLEHRIGSLEKGAVIGNVSYVPENHELMVYERAEKVNRVADMIPDLNVEGNKKGKLLVVGWGSTYGHLRTAVQELVAQGFDASLAHFNHIHPLPRNTRSVLSQFENILVCELNAGQFVNYLKSKFPEFRYEQYNKIQGLPFTVSELIDIIKRNIS